MKSTALYNSRGRIRLAGACEFPLKSVDLELRLGERIVVTGVSGSGKSALAFHTLAREGLRQLLDSAVAAQPGRSSAARKLASIPRPRFQQLTGMPAVIALGQGDLSAPPRATLGDVCGVAPALRLLLARFGVARCPNCKIERPPRSPADVAAEILKTRDGRAIRIFVDARRVRTLANDDGGNISLQNIFESLPARGVLRGWIGNITKGEEIRLDEPFTIPPDATEVYAQIDRLVIRAESARRLLEGIERAVDLGRGIFSIEDGGKLYAWATARACPNCGLELAAPSPRLFLTSAAPGRCESCRGTGSDQKTTNPCAACAGSGFSELAKSIQIENKHIADFSAMDARRLREVIVKLTLPPSPAARELRLELLYRLDSLISLGLAAVAMSRLASTLSTGEAQRARCAAAFGARVQNAFYILDEPTVGLHAEDRARFLVKLKDLAARGNTILVVEHDLDVVRDGQRIIELGPGAGAAGGTVIFDGAPSELLKNGDTPTARALRGENAFARERVRFDKNTKYLQIRGARGNNLKNISVQFPVGAISVVTGVSGCGKSSLVFGTLAGAARRALTGESTPAEALLPHDRIVGLQYFERRVVVGPKLPGRAARSTPASYLGAAGELRELLALTPSAKARGLDASNFSANRSGWRKRDGEDLLQAGRCEACAGLGFRELGLELLESVTVVCEVCRGTRFSASTLEVKWKGRSIADWYQLTIEEAAREFVAIPKIVRALAPAVELGIGYLRFGERADVLSGGELQRLQIARELAKTEAAGAALILLDEPTRGLHSSDVGKLMNALEKLRARGHTIIIVEHSLDVARAADWIVDLGPGAGADGGNVLFEGDPEAFLQQCDSPTARAMSGKLNIQIEKGAPGAVESKGDQFIIVEGARAKNLKNISVHFKRDALSVISGPSGSGKTALACDVVGAAGRRKFIQALAAADRRGLQDSASQEADRVDGTGPTLLFRELPENVAFGDAVGLSPLLRSLFVNFATLHCPNCDRPAGRREPQEARDEAFSKFKDKKVRVTAKIVTGIQQNWDGRMRELRARGYVRILVNGIERRIEETTIQPNDAVELVIDRFVVNGESSARCLEALEEAAVAGGGRGSIADAEGEGRIDFDRLGGCVHCNLQIERLLQNEDFQQKIRPPWAASARVAGARWPEGDFNLTDTKLLLQNAPRALAEPARPLLSAIETRVAAVEGVADESLVFDDVSRGARARASWMSVGAAVAPREALLVFDDPTRGLDEDATNKLLQKIEDAVSGGRTAIVASADPAAIDAADQVVTLGPGAGPNGGDVVETLPFAGTLQKAPGAGEFFVLRAYPEQVDLELLKLQFSARRDILEIGFTKTAAAVPARLLDILTKIAALFARVPEARALGFDARRFDFTNEKGGGRCELCLGRGIVDFEFDFLPGDDGPCPSCGGARYEPRTLEARLYGKTIAEMLNLTIDEAILLFADHPSIAEPLAGARALGLGHLRLGEPPSASNESVLLRFLLARALSRDPERSALLVARAADGLHGADFERILFALRSFAERGGIVVCVDPRARILQFGRPLPAAVENNSAPDTKKTPRKKKAGSSK